MNNSRKKVPHTDNVYACNHDHIMRGNFPIDTIKLLPTPLPGIKKESATNVVFTILVCLLLLILSVGLFLSAHFEPRTKDVENGMVSQQDLFQLRHQILKETQILIETALNTYNADKTALIDFALESFGARVVATPNTYVYTPTTKNELEIDQLPRRILQPSTYPGECFAFIGNTGRVRIKLARTIRITNVSLEHVDKRLVPEVSSAPREFTIKGLKNEEDGNGIELGRFQYDINGNPLQTFSIRDRSDDSYKFVELIILSNNGNGLYTCVYRVRVHGIIT